MERTKADIEAYLNKKKAIIGKANYNLFKEYANKHQGTTTEPTYGRTMNVLIRLTSISQMLNNKPLDTLTEADIIQLNNTMNQKEMKSSKDYRSILKQFFRLLDKKKYFDIIDSDYLRSRRTKKQLKKKLVNPDEFWENAQVDKYIAESKRFSKEYLAFAALLFATGMRPCELLSLTKSSIEYKTEPRKILLINVPAAKTEARLIPIYNGEAEAVHNYIKPYLETLKDDSKLFAKTYRCYYKTHNLLCNKIALPNGKMRKLYVARKMALTRFYRTYDTPKAEAMAGHEHGSGSVAHYIGISKNDLIQDSLKAIERKRCPNPKCSQMNEPHLTNCEQCSSPLDQDKYNKLFQDTMKDFVKDYIDAQMKLKIQELK